MTKIYELNLMSLQISQEWLACHLATFKGVFVLDLKLQENLLSICKLFECPWFLRWCCNITDCISRGWAGRRGVRWEVKTGWEVKMG